MKAQKRFRSCFQSIILMLSALLLFSADAYDEGNDNHISLSEESIEKQRLIDAMDVKINKALTMKGRLEELKKEAYILQEKMRQAAENLGKKPSFSEILSSFENLAVQAGLKPLKFSPAGERKRDFYGELPINVELSGTFYDLGAFFEKIARESRIINISNLNVQGSAGHKSKSKAEIVKASCTLTAFWFLGDPSLENTSKKESLSLNDHGLNQLSDYHFSRFADQEKNLDDIIREQRKLLRQVDVVIEQFLAYERRTSSLEDKLRTVEQLKRNQRVPPLLFEEIARRFPGGLWLTGLENTGDALTLEGYGLARTAAEEFAAELDDSNLFKDIRIYRLKEIKDNEQNIHQFEIIGKINLNNTDAMFKKIKSFNYSPSVFRGIFGSLLHNELNPPPQKTTGIRGMKISEITLAGIMKTPDGILQFLRVRTEKAI